MTDTDMVMAAVLVIALLGLITLSLWHDWRTSTREFREMHRRLVQIQEDRQRGETND